MANNRKIRIILEGVDGPQGHALGQGPGKSELLKKLPLASQTDETQPDHKAEPEVEETATTTVKVFQEALSPTSVAIEPVTITVLDRKRRNEAPSDDEQKLYYGDTDLVLYVVDSTVPLDDAYKNKLRALRRLRQNKAPTSVPILVINKIDSFSERKIQNGEIAEIKNILGCAEAVEVSAQANMNLRGVTLAGSSLNEVLVRNIVKRLQLQTINELFDLAQVPFTSASSSSGLEREQPAEDPELPEKNDFEIYGDSFIQEGREAFKRHLEPARTRILTDFNNDKLNFEQAEALSREIKEIAPFVANGLVTQQEIDKFERNTKLAVSNSIHRSQIIGGLIGAAVGVVLGAIIGGVAGMIIGAAAGGGVASAFTTPLFAAAGVAMGAKIGLGVGAALGAGAGAYVGYKCCLWQHPVTKLGNAALKVKDGKDIADTVPEPSSRISPSLARRLAETDE